VDKTREKEEGNTKGLVFVVVVVVVVFGYRKMVNGNQKMSMALMICSYTYKHK